MKWMAAILAAIVFAIPLGFAQEVSSETHAVSATDLRFKQIGQAFGDFVFHVKAFLTFDEKAKVELIKERNAQLQERQHAWVEVKAAALEKFESDLSAEEKQDIEAMIQVEHEAIIKEHLRLTSQLREIQLKAKASGDAQLESAAETVADSRSSLSLGLVRVEINGEGTRAVLVGTEGTAKIHVQSNVVLDSETKAAISQFAESFSAEQDAKVEIEVEKEASGNASVEQEITGTLTAEQQSLLADLETKAEALVEASARTDAQLEIEIRHKAAIENKIDTAAEARAVVEKRLGFETSTVTTETRDGETVFVVVGTETKTAGNYELTKTFEVVVEADSGLILSADMSAHFERTASAVSSVSGSASSDASASTSAEASSSVSGSAVASGSMQTGGTAGSSASAGSSVSGEASASGNAGSGAVSGSSNSGLGMTIG